MADDEGDRYLYVVEYTEDAERKRVEYLFNNWERGDVSRPEGLVRIVEGGDHDELFEQLVTKVPADQVSSYRLEPAEADVSERTETVTQTVNAATDAVESFVEYMFSKKKAVLQSAANNEYEVYTKKGRADVTYRLTEEGPRETTVRIRVRGYPPAPAFLADFFETELSDYAESQA